MKYIKNLFSMFKSGISRFVFAFFGSAAMFVLTVIVIFTESDSPYIIRMILALNFSVILSVAAQIASQRFKLRKRFDIIQKVVSALTVVPCYFLIWNIFDNLYLALGYFGTIIVIIAAALYFLINDENKHVLIPYIIKNSLFAGFISLIFFVGIAICIAAFNFLIIEITDIYKYFLSVYAFSGLVLFFNIFLSLLPHDETELKIPKAFKFITFYVAFPIYVLLLAVLYIYLGKIIFTLNMPGGQINLFASLALLFFIFFHFTILQYSNSVTAFFNKFGGYILLPILTMQAIAVYIRVNAYGLTSIRWISILLTLTALVYIIMSLIKEGRYTKYVILFFIFICIISSFGPLNVIDIPIYEQTSRLEAVLTKNGMLENGIIIPKADISEDDKRKIRSCYNELKYSKKVPAFLNNEKEFIELFGFENIGSNYENVTEKYVNKYRRYDEIDIAGYKKYYQISAYKEENTNRCYVNIASGKYDITDKIIMIDNNSPDNAMIIAISDNLSLYISRLDYSIKNTGEILYFSLEGFAISK